MVVATDTNVEYKYNTTIHPFSDRYDKPSNVTTATSDTTISQYTIGTNSIVIGCTPMFHSNSSLMSENILGYKVDGVDILANKSPRLLYDSAGAALTLTGQSIPSTATGLYVIMWGAGGGGGGGAYQDGAGSDGRGAGGGGSGQCIGFGLPVSTLTYSFYTGTGGAPGLGGGSDSTHSSNATTGGYGSVGGDTTFSYGLYKYFANGGAGGKKGRVANSSEGATSKVNDGAGGTGFTKSVVAAAIGTTNIVATDPNAKTDGNSGAGNSTNTGGAGGAPVQFSRIATGFTSYNVDAVTGVGETGTGSENQSMSTFKAPIVADGMTKGGGGAGGAGDTSGSAGGFTGVPGSHGHIRIYVYFDNAPAGRYL
jgi:hypothetical protein